ncbi:Uncharacterised protein [uncultured archaeon]|nr:Uncharacterised protein [uncultured archaeon]
MKEKIFSHLRRLSTIALGSGLYALLNWVPLAGPAAAGFAVGYLSKGRLKAAFVDGVVSGALGFVLIAATLYHFGAFTGSSIVHVAVLAWLLLMWNLTGILVMGAGAAVGNITYDTGRMISSFLSPFAQKQAPEERKFAAEYGICPQCGTGNISENAICETCGLTLFHESK